jgi:hypothetical protein
MYFPKFLQIVPLISKAGTTVTSAFKSILKNPQNILHLYKDGRFECEQIMEKKFESTFPRHVKHLGFEIQVFRNPEVMFSIIE